jgi:hypothetical protein
MATSKGCVGRPPAPEADVSGNHVIARHAFVRRSDFRVHPLDVTAFDHLGCTNAAECLQRRGHELGEALSCLDQQP